MKITNSDIALLLFRLFAGCRIIYEVTDNVASKKHMQEFAEFLKNNSFPLPELAAPVYVYAQLICGSLLIVGWKTKYAALILILNFLIAVFAVHIRNSDSFEATTPALSLLIITISLWLTGAGKISLDN